MTGGRKRQEEVATHSNVQKTISPPHSLLPTRLLLLAVVSAAASVVGEKAIAAQTQMVEVGMTVVMVMGKS